MQNTYLMVEKKKQPSLKFQNNTNDNLLKKKKMKECIYYQIDLPNATKVHAIDISIYT